MCGQNVAGALMCLKQQVIVFCVQDFFDHYRYAQRSPFTSCRRFTCVLSVQGHGTGQNILDTATSSEGDFMQGIPVRTIVPSSQRSRLAPTATGTAMLQEAYSGLNFV